MRYEYDPRKSHKNKADKTRAFGFEIAEGFDWRTAITLQDERRDYGEPRYISYGMIENRLHVMVWTKRRNKRRVISLRKANVREERRYEKEKTKH